MVNLCSIYPKFSTFVSMKKQVFSLATALKGMAMGIAEVIPGVSGGTIAFITGIYERLINTIKAFGPELFAALKSGGIKAGWQAVNGNFLLSLVSGMVIGIGVGVFGVTHLLENYPVLLWAFFFGLIIASAVYIGKQVPQWKVTEIMALLVGVGIAYWITVAVPAEGTEALWFVFISGAIAISALLLPGISGSFILLLLGMYTFIIPTVKEALKTLEGDKLLILVVFAAGCAAGLVTFSRILSWTFKHFQTPTLALLTGFMLGSLNKIWPWRIPVTGLTEEGEKVNWTAGVELDKVIEEMNVSPATYESLMGENHYLVGAILAALAGLAIVFLLERFGTVEDLEEEQIYHE